MNYFAKLDTNRQLYSENFISQDYNHKIYLRKAVDDGSNRFKVYLNIYTTIYGTEQLQGFLYFYLNPENKTSDFIGLRVCPEYRNINIASLLVSCWIDICLNSGYNFLGTNEKQRKPFLLYLLKTYGFEVLDTSLYKTRSDIISICKGLTHSDRRKLLLFKDERHEKTFVSTNTFKEDNYAIIHHPDEGIMLDDVIMPLQSFKNNKVKYELLNQNKARNKVERILNRHKK